MHAAVALFPACSALQVSAVNYPSGYKDILYREAISVTTTHLFTAHNDVLQQLVSYYSLGTQQGRVRHVLYSPWQE